MAPTTVYVHYGIINSAAVGTANINSNVIRSHRLTTTTGTLLEFQVQEQLLLR
jgi:hypothetical protein